MFSKACEYGIRATLHIARATKDGSRVGLKEIAKAIDSPVAFTAKILQMLAKNDIIDSMKGPNGGFEMSDEKRARVKMIQIVTAIDGNKIFDGCALGLKLCNEKKPCPLHNSFKPIRNSLKNMLETNTVDAVATNMDEGNFFLKL